MTESVELLRVREMVQGSSTWTIPSFGEGQFADSDVPVVLGGSATYEPLAWSRSPVNSTLVDARGDLEIEIPQDCDWAVALRSMSSAWRVEILRATALTRDAGHIDTSTSVRIAIARVSRLEVRGSSAVVVCRSPRALLERIGPRDRFVDTCRYSLYGPGCGVDPLDHDDTVTVTSVSGAVVTAPFASAAGFLVGGFATCEGQVRLIIASPGDGTITCDRPWLNPGDLAGETMVCLPGCRRTLNDCENKFNNLPRFGGLPTTENPWSRRRTWGDP